MAKENGKQLNQYNAKVIVFWSLIIAITVLFAILFGIRFSESRVFKSYEDIEKANLNLHYDISSEKGEYYVYIYSTKENEDGKLVDTSKTDITKANDIFPTILNYFNYVRRNERLMKDQENFRKIYGYDVKNRSKDDVLASLELELSKLPALVAFDGDNDSIIQIFTSAKEIQSELSEIMNKK